MREANRRGGTGGSRGRGGPGRGKHHYDMRLGLIEVGRGGMRGSQPRGRGRGRGMGM